jgi:CBS domain-containing protein
MTRRVATVREDDTLAFASQILRWRVIRHLPVLDAEDHLVGILSDRDLLQHVVEGPAGALPLREVMHTAVETIGPDAPLAEASAKLAIARIDCLPVVRGRKLLGILTSADVLAERGRIAGKNARSRVPIAADVMNRRVLVSHLGDTLFTAIQKLVDAGVRHLPVVDEDYRVVGIVSDRDVRTTVGDPRAALDREGDEMLDEILVDQLMSPNPITVSPETSVLEIADMLLDERVGAVPVVGPDDSLLGIVSYVDVIAHFVGRRHAA